MGEARAAGDGCAQIEVSCLLNLMRTRVRNRVLGAGGFLGWGGAVQLRRLQQRHEQCGSGDGDLHRAAGGASLLATADGVVFR